ncbi:hypothetical protein DY023_06610 [Microbacterium bovistercoris]|uniref:Uncharacterized protein n=1 Tax=Microbacterium bovistercoris TaxID=2293570 RepID=A0A371NUX7_9MICO|nr:hypothetical protein [Microbacterium bovistercoris]REJ06297.1 hypothetical protein DY023_06610 [Microbacterium bovistercoris]
MGLDTFNYRLNNLRDRLDKRKETFYSEAARVRNDPRLNDAAKRTDIAKLYRAAQQDVDALHAEERKLTSDEQQRIERQVFGIRDSDPSALIAYRDAQDRAARLVFGQQDTAREMLRSATLSGDSTLAAAVVAKAFTYGWTDIIDSYREANPRQANDIDDLAELSSWVQKNESDFFRGYVGTFHISEPQELSGMHEYAVKQLAETAE